MKKALILGIVLLLPILLMETDEVTEGIDALLETVDLSDWDAWFLAQDGEWISLPSDYLREVAAAEATETAGPTLTGIGVQLMPSVRSAAAKVAILMGLSVIGAIVQGLSDASQIGETARIAFRICAAGTVLALSFAEVRSALSAIDTVGRTGELILPALTGFLTMSGMEHTALLLSTTQSMLSEIILRLIGICIAPLAVLGGVLFALDAGEGRLASIGRIMHRAAKWVLGTACSLFLIVTAIRSVTAGSADGLLLKTTKFAAGSIPSVGSLLSESVDTAFQCLCFVKNALGVTGCAVIVSIALKPVLSVTMTRSALRVSALLSEPLSGKPYAELLRAMGDMLHLLMLSELAVIAAALMMIAPVFGIGRFI